MRRTSWFGLIAIMVFCISQTVLATVTLTGKYEMLSVQGGAYIIGNNVWGANTKQTLSVDRTTGAFTVTKSTHCNGTNKGPASYPSIFKGSHWRTSTIRSGMPVQVSKIKSVNTHWNVTIIDSGIYNCAYDVWLNKSPSTNERPDGAELMIWINYNGSIQPAGFKKTMVSIAGIEWSVWESDDMDPKYIAYLTTSKTNEVSFDINDFILDSVSRGYIQRDWYLIDVETGFEIWSGGQGLTSNIFSVEIEK
jgi:hypothetical protein